MARALTLRRVGIAGAIAGVLGLVAPFAPAAWKWFWPDPFATIDWPEAGDRRDGCFVVSGRLDPKTFWRRPLWLIAAQEGRGWRPLTRVAPWLDTWQYQVCVHGQSGDRNQFALVVADQERDEAFARQRVQPLDEPLPAWLTRRYGDEQVAGCPGRRRGFDALPLGARMLASVQVRVQDGDVQPCFISMGRGPVWPSGAYERQWNLRHDEGGVLRGRHRLQRAVVRGVAARGDRVGGARP